MNLSYFYSNKPVLITGGLGFIGSNLAIALVKLGANVTILDALIPGLGGNRFNIEPVKNRVSIHIGDLGNLGDLGKLSTFSLIFNLAGTHSHIDSMKDPLKDLVMTCQPQLSFLETVRKTNPKTKIVLAGTRSQYGKSRYLPVDERHPTNPLDINGANWLAVENYHLLYHRVYGLKTCSLRLTNAYGPRHQMKTPYHGILNWFIRLVLDGQSIPLYGKGTQIRDATFIDDVVHAFLLAGASEKSDGQVYNLGGSPIALKKFCETVLSLSEPAGGPPGELKILYKPFPIKQKRIEPGNYVANWEKIKNDLGWKPRIGLEDGIKKTLTYYTKNKSHYW